MKPAYRVDWFKRTRVVTPWELVFRHNGEQETIDKVYRVARSCLTHQGMLLRCGVVTADPTDGTAAAAAASPHLACIGPDDNPIS